MRIYIIYQVLSANKKWYTELRRKTCDLYMGDGKQIRDHANGMNDRDHDYVSDMATTPSELKTDIRVFRK